MGWSLSPAPIALLPNQRPTIEVTQAPVRSDQPFFYGYEMRWAGFDQDGRIDHFRYAIDPPTQAGSDTVWVSTRDNRRSFLFGSSQVDTLTDKTAEGFHTIVLEAVDDRGGISAPVTRSLTSFTIAPTVQIVQPVPNHLFSPMFGPSFRLGWKGEDPDGRGTNKPVKYKYKVFVEDGPEFDFITLLVLGEMDKPRLEYRDAVSEYVSKLLALARRSVDANPELARRCVDRILAVCPDHPGALLLKAAIPASVSAPEPKGNEELLFNGKDLQGFADHAPIFSVKKGVVVAEGVNGSWLLRTERVLKGDYSVEYEARVLQDAGDKPCLAFGFGFRKDERTYQIEVHVDYLLFRIRDFTSDQTQKFRRIDFYRLKTPLDRTKWNVFRVDVRDNVATVTVNGESFASNRQRQRGLLDPCPGELAMRMVH